MTTPHHNVGALVSGAPTSPRALVRHAELLAAYADGEIDDGREAYLSHFVFGAEMQAHYQANRHSVAGYSGPCCARWLVLDIDRPDLQHALTDVRRLIDEIAHRYDQSIDQLLVYFSGDKGYHVLIDLAHSPPPAVEFHRVARAFAETIAAGAGVTIDTSVYDIAHIIRLPNTRHPRTGLFKRRLDAEALLRLDVAGVLDLARHPAGDGMPTAPTPPARLAVDWVEAERKTARAVEARAVIRQDCGAADARAPRYFLDLLRFGVGEGERHQTLFRCAAWLTEQGAPLPLCHALLTEPGWDIGLPPKDVERQIRCGIAHAQRQRGAAAGPAPADPDAAAERLAIEHESDPLSPGTTDFPFGLAADAGPYTAEWGRP